MEELLKDKEVIEDLEYKGLKIIQNKDGFCFGMDSVLLSDFAKKIKKDSVVVDLGTGTGIIGILLCGKTNLSKIYGIEIQELVADMAARSIYLNHLEDKMEIIQENVINLPKTMKKGSIDVVVTNPPYKKENSGITNESETKRISRHEVYAKLEDFIKIAAFLLKAQGELYMVNRPERLVDILTEMRNNEIEPKEMRMVVPKEGEEPNLVLIKGVKKGKPFLKVNSPLMIYNKDGEYTDEILSIYEKKREDKQKYQSSSQKGSLNLVATPIGNLEDITLRAIRILKEADLIAAEDTRHTLKLLNHLGINKPMISYYRHNEETKSDILLEKLKEGKNIALVSDAGTPGISDPGEEIVKKAIVDNIKVTPIPGACAFVNALVASGLDTKSFLFIGFLPSNKKNRKDKLEIIQQEENTCILYEAPHKIVSTLADLKDYIGERKVVLAKELTKIHEEFLFGTIEELLEKIGEPKGEFVILIEGTEKKEKNWQEVSIEEHYEYYEQQGYDKKEIIKQVAKDRKVNKNEIYQVFMKKDMNI